MASWCLPSRASINQRGLGADELLEEAAPTLGLGSPSLTVATAVAGVAGGSTTGSDVGEVAEVGATAASTSAPIVSRLIRWSRSQTERRSPPRTARAAPSTGPVTSTDPEDMVTSSRSALGSHDAVNLVPVTSTSKGPARKRHFEEPVCTTSASSEPRSSMMDAPAGVVSVTRARPAEATVTTVPSVNRSGVSSSSLPSQSPVAPATAPLPTVNDSGAGLVADSTKNTSSAASAAAMGSNPQVSRGRASRLRARRRCRTPALSAGSSGRAGVSASK